MFSGACHPEISEDIFCIIPMEKACHPYKDCDVHTLKFSAT